jgi:hypothetical protein
MRERSYGYRNHSRFQHRRSSVANSAAATWVIGAHEIAKAGRAGLKVASTGGFGLGVPNRRHFRAGE